MLVQTVKVSEESNWGIRSPVEKAEDIVSRIIAKGFILGTDSLQKAKAFDQKHSLSSRTTAKVSSIDKKMGITENMGKGAAVINHKVKEVDQKFRVSEKTKSPIAITEQKAGNAGSAMMKNRYVFAGTAWVTDAFHRVRKVAEDVGAKAKEKVAKAEKVGGAKSGDQPVEHRAESPKGIGHTEPSSPPSFSAQGS